MSTDLDFITQLAHDSGLLLKSYFKLDGIQAERKADQTILTEADLAADKFISERIQAHYPGEAILSEEGRKSIHEGDEVVWVIDPLDGTTNFSLGLQLWGVSIARLVGGEPELGALYFPMIDELYSGARGEGAWLNGNPIHTKTREEMQEGAFFSCCTQSLRNYEVRVPYKTRILGSAAYDMCALAHGAGLVGFQVKTKIWDIAAGWLLIEEAGGVVEAFQAPQPFPLSAQIDYAEQPFPILMAASPELFREALRQIQPRRQPA